MRTLSRRKIIKSIGAGSTAVWFALPVSGNVESQKRIVTQRQRGGVYETQKVPRRWYEHEKEVDRAYTELQGSLKHENTIDSTAVEITERKIAGMRVSSPVAKVKSDKGDNKDQPAGDVQIPEEIGGIPINVREAPEEKGLTNCYNAATFDPVPGGVWMEGTGTDPLGTTGCTVERDGIQFMWTAAHLFMDNSRCGWAGREADQWNGELGMRSAGNYREDWAVVAPAAGINLSTSIWNSDEDSPFGVRSYLTYDGLGYWMSNGIIVHKQGRTTGSLTGEITERRADDTVSCVNTGGSGVAVSVDTVGGDSGGPIYGITNHHRNEATMIASTSGGTSRRWFASYDCSPDSAVYSRTFGWPAYRMVQDGYEMGW